MSYARNNGVDSDVYVYLHCDGFLECCGCSILKRSVHFTKTRDILKHLKVHTAMGHKVPERAFTGLLSAAKQNDAWIKARLKQQGGDRHEQREKGNEK